MEQNLQTSYELLAKAFPDLKKNELLKKHSTFAIGGVADLFYLCRDVNLIPQIIKECKKLSIPYFVIGGGSNVLFDSKGFRGLMLKIADSTVRIQGNLVKAASGVKMTSLAKETMTAGLSGLEWANGLPGTIGGAIFGNAGCHEHEISEFVEKATIFNLEKGVFEVNKDYLKFGYRSSKLKKTDDIILNATLKLTKTKADFQKSFDAANFRSKKQPYGFTNGSFFKNPKGFSAGKLIDEAGLKGYKIGGAQISDKHANFFMNIENASSNEILTLSDLAKAKVKEKFGIKLEEEVIIVGESPEGVPLGN